MFVCMLVSLSRSVSLCVNLQSRPCEDTEVELHQTYGDIFTCEDNKLSVGIIYNSHLSVTDSEVWRMAECTQWHADVTELPRWGGEWHRV